jgi:hypothetical protein
MSHIYWLNKTANVCSLSNQKSEICPLEKSRGDDTAGHYEGEMFEQAWQWWNANKGYTVITTGYCCNTLFQTEMNWFEGFKQLWTDKMTHYLDKCVAH